MCRSLLLGINKAAFPHINIKYIKVELILKQSQVFVAKINVRENVTLTTFFQFIKIYLFTISKLYLKFFNLIEMKYGIVDPRLHLITFVYL